MDLIRTHGHPAGTFSDAAEADRYARMMEETLIDIDELDIDSFPPDRRFFLADREAWVYEHGNICELVFVRVDHGE
ncbi:MAG: hypothetical protein BroJett030_10520 [Alphaproteobacteria bacterium]|nr:MAG: hypothetical protein BroJett030_10520 [Alphaproteobacteria bacterium]